MLSILGLTAVMLIQARGEIAVVPEVTALLLHHSAMNAWTDCIIFSTG